jgi:hypothetical protein
MYNLLDYDEPYVRTSTPLQTRPVAPPPPTTNSSANDDEDDEDDPTVQDFLTALLQIQRAAETAQEKARLEALVRQRLAKQEQEKREAVAQLYRQAMMEAIQEAAAEEERKRRQAALVQFFQGLGLQ